MKIDGGLNGWTVTIKGNARGLTVILDENADYQTIKEALTKNSVKVPKIFRQCKHGC